MGFVKTGTDIEQPDDGVYVYGSAEAIANIICKSPEKLGVLLNSISPGKDIHYVSDGDWSTHDLVMELVKQFAPVELFITTYAIREFPVRQLILAQERKEIVDINMLIDYRAKARTPEVFQLASMNMNRIHLTNIHAKVTVIKSEKACITIMGSANWTSNPRIECGVVSMDKALADFHIDWIKKVMNDAEIFE